VSDLSPGMDIVYSYIVVDSLCLGKDIGWVQLVRVDRQMLLVLPIDRLVTLILCTDICLNIREHQAYDISEMDTWDEVILSLLR
jgi:hypothetical protein